MPIQGGDWAVSLFEGILHTGPCAIHPAKGPPPFSPQRVVVSSKDIGLGLGGLSIIVRADGDIAGHVAT